MTSTTRATTPTLLAVIALLALLLSLLGGTAAVATADDSGDDAGCTQDEAPAETDASSSTDETDEDCGDDDGGFTDVPANFPHVEGISWLESTNVTKGCKAGRFCPNKPVTRAEFATLAARLLGEVDDIEPVVAPAAELEALQDRVTELEATVSELDSRLTALE